MATLAEVFGEVFGNKKFDGKLAKALYNYQVGYLNSNREYIEFYGGNLLGVQVIRFKDSDVTRLFSDVLDIDYFELAEKIKTVPEIVQERLISSDTLNLTMMYVIHRFMTSPIINDTQRHRACYDCGMIFNYRCMAALLSYYFRYPADPRTAQMTYANLSNKYLIKRLGSWSKVMDYRTEELISKESIHYKSLVNFNNDSGIVYAINDSQSRIKDMIKNIYSEMMNVHNSGSKIGTTSSTFLDMEGEETVKEKTRSVENYVEYLKTIVHDRHSFIKDELVMIINRINVNTSHRMIKSVLTWMNENYGVQKYHKLIDEFIELTIIHSFFLIQDNETVPNLRDYPTILITLKNLYLSTRSTDKDLLRIRDLGEKIVHLANKEHISNSLVLSTRTSIILYLVLRTLIGKNMK